MLTMQDLTEREFVQSQSVATAAYIALEQVLEVEYYNGLVYQFHDISAEIGALIFEEREFDRVFRKEIAGKKTYTLKDRLLPVFGGI